MNSNDLSNYYKLPERSSIYIAAYGEEITRILTSKLMKPYLKTKLFFTVSSLANRIDEIVSPSISLDDEDVRDIVNIDFLDKNGKPIRINQSIKDTIKLKMLAKINDELHKRSFSSHLPDNCYVAKLTNGENIFEDMAYVSMSALMKTIEKQKVPSKEKRAFHECWIEVIKDMSTLFSLTPNKGDNYSDINPNIHVVNAK